MREGENKLQQPPAFSAGGVRGINTHCAACPALTPLLLGRAHSFSVRELVFLHPPVLRVGTHMIKVLPITAWLPPPPTP